MPTLQHLAGESTARRYTLVGAEYDSCQRDATEVPRRWRKRVLCLVPTFLGAFCLVVGLLKGWRVRVAHVRGAVDLWRDRPWHDWYDVEQPLRFSDGLDDCREGAHTYKDAWTDAKKDHCCKRYKVGCPNSEDKGCSQACIYKKYSSTCHDRIEFLRKHNGSQAHCGWAYKQVMWECGDQCDGCNAEDLGCPSSTDCDQDLDQVRTAWEPQKQKWCCKEYGKGCLDECGLQLPNDMQEDEKVGCCMKHPDLKGCKEAGYTCDESRSKDWCKLPLQSGLCIQTNEKFCGVDECGIALSSDWPEAQQVQCCMRHEGLKGCKEAGYTCDESDSKEWCKEPLQVGFCLKSNKGFCGLDKCGEVLLGDWSEEQKVDCCMKHPSEKGCHENGYTCDESHSKDWCKKPLQAGFCVEANPKFCGRDDCLVKPFGDMPQDQQVTCCLTHRSLEGCKEAFFTCDESETKDWCKRPQEVGFCALENKNFCGMDKCGEEVMEDWLEGKKIGCCMRHQDLKGCKEVGFTCQESEAKPWCREPQSYGFCADNNKMFCGVDTACSAESFGKLRQVDQVNCCMKDDSLPGCQDAGFTCAESKAKEWCKKPLQSGLCVKANKKFCGFDTRLEGLGGPYDCIMHFGDWEHSWSENKKDWCCLMHDRGCTGGPTLKLL